MHYDIRQLSEVQLAQRINESGTLKYNQVNEIIEEVGQVSFPEIFATNLGASILLTVLDIKTLPGKPLSDRPHSRMPTIATYAHDTTGMLRTLDYYLKEQYANTQQDPLQHVQQLLVQAELYIQRLESSSHVRGHYLRLNPLYPHFYFWLVEKRKEYSFSNPEKLPKSITPQIAPIENPRMLAPGLSDTLELLSPIRRLYPILPERLQEDKAKTKLLLHKKLEANGHNEKRQITGIDKKNIQTILSFEDVLSDQGKKALTYIQNNYKNIKPKVAAYLLMALKDLKFIEEKILTDNQVLLHTLYTNLLSSVGSRQSLNINVNKLLHSSSGSDEP